MMSNTAFINDWNSIIPFKIKSADLEKPNEQFVYKAVLHFFKLMQYDVSSYENMYSDSIENSTVKRELVARINYIYQLCSDSKQTSFFYVDLVKPTSKKIIHLLKILLNYLFYMNMVKETVLEKAKDCLEKYFELNSKLNQEQTANEENKIRAKNMNRNIDDLKHQLPEVVRQIEEQKQLKNICNEKLFSLKVNHQQLVDKIVLLKLEHAELLEQKVSNDEVCSLKSSCEMMDVDIESLMEYEKHLQKTNTVHVKTINELKSCSIILDKLLLQSEFDEFWKTLRKDIEELKLECGKAKSKYNDLLSMIKTLNTNLTETEAHLEQRQQEFSVRKKVLDKSERKNDCKFIAHEQYTIYLQETKNSLAQILDVKRMELKQITEMSQESLTFLTTSTI